MGGSSILGSRRMKVLSLSINPVSICLLHLQGTLQKCMLISVCKNQRRPRRRSQRPQQQQPQNLLQQQHQPRNLLQVLMKAPLPLVSTATVQQMPTVAIVHWQRKPMERLRTTEEFLKPKEAATPRRAAWMMTPAAPSQIFHGRITNG